MMEEIVLWVVEGFFGGYVARLAAGFIALALLKRITLRLGIYRRVKPVFYPFLIVFFAYDIIVNWMLTLVFLDPPAFWKETVTGRMKRYLREEIDWRRDVARRVCRFLERFDPGHCGGVT